MVLVSRGRVANLLVSVDRFEARDIGRLAGIADLYDFNVVFSPDAEPPLDQMRRILNSRSPEELDRATAHPRFDFTPPTDARPYFFNILRPGNFLRMRSVSAGVIAGNLRDTTTLVLLFFVTTILVVGVIFWPLVAAGLPRMRAGTFALAAAYFAMIGSGFMLIQIPFLQRFSVYLGHPTYSFTITLFSMIFFTGIGSFLSERVAVERTRWRCLLPTALATATLAIILGIQPVIDATFHLSTSIRCLIVVGMIAPLSVLLGFCFPLGMRLVARISPDAMAWMWGVNGACGVLASVAAVGVSISFGIDTNLWVALLLYLALMVPALALGSRSLEPPAAE